MWRLAVVEFPDWLKYPYSAPLLVLEIDEVKLASVLQQLLDLSPRGIRTHLGLNKPIYARTAAYGHFGRSPESDGGFSWERLDLVDELQRAL